MKRMEEGPDSGDGEPASRRRSGSPEPSLWDADAPSDGAAPPDALAGAPHSEAASHSDSGRDVSRTGVSPARERPSREPPSNAASPRASGIPLPVGLPGKRASRDAAAPSPGDGARGPLRERAPSGETSASSAAIARVIARRARAASSTASAEADASASRWSATRRRARLNSSPPAPTVGTSVHGVRAAGAVVLGPGEVNTPTANGVAAPASPIGAGTPA